MESGHGLLAIFNCIAFSNFSTLFIGCNNYVVVKAVLSGSFRGLFVHFFCHSIAIIFLKTVEYRASVFAVVSFSFSSHGDLSIGLIAVVNIPSSSSDFMFHHRPVAPRKTHEIGKKINGCREFRLQCIQLFFPKLCLILKIDFWSD